MGTIDSITPAVLTFIKIALWLFLILYILFAGIVIKQVRVMTETLQIGLEKPIRTLAVIHFIVSVFVFVLSLIIL